MVNACSVVAHGEEGEDKYLAAYVVPEGKVKKKAPPLNRWTSTISITFTEAHKHHMLLSITGCLSLSD